MILAAGLTPAWQQILVFDAFQPGEVNRAREAHWCGSGKVLNVGIALHHLGASSLTLSPAGGLPAQAIAEEFAQLGVPVGWIATEATRVCTTILDQQTTQATELVESAAPLTPVELATFCAAFHAEASRAKLIVLSGSLPAGTPDSFYRDLLQPYADKTILDARGPELWEALPAGPLLVKPNREELARTVGRPLMTDDEVWAAALVLRHRGAQWVVITQGPHPAFVAGPEGRWRVSPPRTDVVNTIGCGDCMAAGIAVALAEVRPMLEAIQFGTAAAAENARHLLPARLNRTAVETLEKTVICE